MQILVVLLTLFLDNLPAGSCFDCYSCTYTRSSDPSIDYDCVTSPTNVTVGQPIVACTAPFMCVTKALYNEDMSHIRSVTRSCQPQQEICAGQKCCSLDGPYKACEYKCREDLCNDNNPEEHFRGNGGGGGSGANSVTSTIWMISLICLSFVIVVMR